MSALAPMPEKHGGELAGRSSVRVWLRLLSCTMAIEKRVRRGLAAGFATTLPRFDVLAALERRPEGMTMGELSRALLVSNGNVTAIVRALAAEGLVAAEPVATDRRASRVRLTAAGAARFAAMAAAHHQWVEDLFAGLAPAEREALYTRLGRLRQSIAAAAQGANDGS
jgi:DNA-binding MarR family transcriptional regulator